VAYKIPQVSELLDGRGKSARKAVVLEIYFLQIFQVSNSRRDLPTEKIIAQVQYINELQLA
jgi:hypothetical protein